VSASALSITYTCKRPVIIDVHSPLWCTSVYSDDAAANMMESVRRLIDNTDDLVIREALIAPKDLINLGSIGLAEEKGAGSGNPGLNPK